MGHDLGSVSSSSSSARALLAPGFRFHPTDEELVSYYLKRKVSRKRFRSDAISEVDVYKCEPWDLPGKSKLKSRDVEWYFFTALDKKYGNGSRTNRATERGYWKTTGKDRTVSHKLQTVGMKKTLVYHSGRAPRGQRTNWVMHEYRLLDEELAKAEVYQDAFVLCRIFQKSGSGPKNGEQYGAPFVEEEWECDDLVVVPDKEVSDETAVDNDFYIDSKDLEQILDTSNTVEDIPDPLSCFRNNISHVQEPPVEESAPALQKQPERQLSSDFAVQNHMDVKPVNQELYGESSNVVNDLNFLLNEPFFDAISNAPLDDVPFLETDDLSMPVEVDPHGLDVLDNCLNYFDADDDISQYLAFNSSNMVGSEQLDVADQVSPNLMLVNGEAKQENVESQQFLQGYDDDHAFGSEQKPENVESGAQDSFIKKASHMLGGISAPPAFASEFPVKESAALRLSSDSISSSLHLTAGMVQIPDLTPSGFETKWAHQEKNINLSFVLSFGLSSHNVSGNSYESSVRDLLGKAGPVMYLLFIWVIILSVTYKVGTCFYEGNTAS